MKSHKLLITGGAIIYDCSNFADQNTCMPDYWLLPWWRTIPAFGQTTDKGPEGRFSEVNYMKNNSNADRSVGDQQLGICCHN